ncbi:MAG: hypothetical protein RL350_1303 [Pseudomonadota bacterium]
MECLIGWTYVLTIKFLTVKGRIRITDAPATACCQDHMTLQICIFSMGKDQSISDEAAVF